MVFFPKIRERRKNRLAAKEKEWEKNKIIIERRVKLRNAQKEFYSSLKPKKKTTTTKLLILFLFINCTLIEIFTGWATIQSINVSMLTGYSPDFSPLVSLIGTVVGEVISFGVYAAKSVKENTAGGIVYDTAMMNAQAAPAAIEGGRGEDEPMDGGLGEAGAEPVG